MKLLAIDTALNACSVAIVADDAVLARIVLPGGKGNAERLLPIVEQARAAAGIALADLDGIAATIGPGSFTGIRTALATARALGLALDRPVWGITTTEALAFAAARPGIATVAVIDARRDELYLQAFSAAPDGAGDPLQPPQLLPVRDAAAQLPAGPLTLVGSGAALLQQAAGRSDLAIADAASDPDPVIVARLAMRRPAPARAPAPLYIRPPDAALPKAEQPRAQLAVKIETCGVEAAALLAAIHADAFDEAWSAQALAELLAMPGAMALLARSGDQPAGFLLLRRAADEAEIITIAVRRRLQRLGVARALLQDGFARLAEAGVRRCFLEVADDNRAAQALYAGFGFSTVGRRPGYYGQGEAARDALVLQAAITTPTV